MPDPYRTRSIILDAQYRVVIENGIPLVRVGVDMLPKHSVLQVRVNAGEAPFRPEHGVLVAELPLGLMNPVEDATENQAEDSITPAEISTIAQYQFVRRLWVQPEELPIYARGFAFSRAGETLQLALHGSGYLSGSDVITPFSLDDLQLAVESNDATPDEIDQALSTFAAYHDDLDQRTANMLAMPWSTAYLVRLLESALPNRARTLQLLNALQERGPRFTVGTSTFGGTFGGTFSKTGVKLAPDDPEPIIPRVVQSWAALIRSAADQIRMEVNPAQDPLVLDDLRIAIDAARAVDQFGLNTFGEGDLERRWLVSGRHDLHTQGFEASLPLRAFLYQRIGSALIALLGVCRDLPDELLFQDDFRVVLQAARWTGNEDTVTTALEFVSRRFQPGGLMEATRRDLVDLIRVVRVQTPDAIGFICNQMLNLDSQPARIAAVQAFACFSLPAEADYPGEMQCMDTALDLLSDADSVVLRQDVIEAVGGARLWDEGGQFTAVLRALLFPTVDSQPALTLQESAATTWIKLRDPLLFSENVLDMLEGFYTDTADSAFDFLPMPWQMLRDEVTRTNLPDQMSDYADNVPVNLPVNLQGLFAPIAALFNAFAGRAALITRIESLHSAVVEAAIAANVGTVQPGLIEMSEALRKIRRTLDLRLRTASDPPLTALLETVTGLDTQRAGLDRDWETNAAEIAEQRALWLSARRMKARHALIREAIYAQRMTTRAMVLRAQERLRETPVVETLE